MVNEVKLIDLNTLWKCETCFHHKSTGCDTWCDAGEAYRPAASKLKVIDPESLRPTGRWIWSELYDNNWRTLCCSNCFETEGARENAKYCPNCGAYMKGEL